MPWKVDPDLCTGCGLCTEHEGYFELDTEGGVSVMIKPEASSEDPECVEASEDCPTEAVYWEE